MIKLLPCNTLFLVLATQRRRSNKNKYTADEPIAHCSAKVDFQAHSWLRLHRNKFYHAKIVAEAKVQEANQQGEWEYEAKWVDGEC